jgi:Na+/glutamate symporter
MKLGKALLGMVAGFAAGTLLGALFVIKKRRKPTKEELQKEKSL